MIPILDIFGIVSSLIPVVASSGIAAELQVFVTARLTALPASSYARVKVIDFDLIYLGVSSKQTVIEVAEIPAPL